MFSLQQVENEGAALQSENHFHAFGELFVRGFDGDGTVWFSASTV